MMRDKLAKVIVDANLRNKTAGETADDIIQALPGMVKPLVWLPDPGHLDCAFCDTFGMYQITTEDAVILWIGHAEDGIVFPTLEAAQAAANAHHQAAIMRAMGVTE